MDHRLGMETFYPVMWASWTAVELSCQFTMIVFWADTFTASICSEIRILAAFSWMTFVMLIGMFGWTLTMAIIASKRGDTYIWRLPAQLYEKRDIYVDPPKHNMCSDASMIKAQEADLERAHGPLSSVPKLTMHSEAGTAKAHEAGLSFQVARTSQA
ncbi:hypothetical protein CALCODRAFT_511016 [Calocera cornea HHB12733]|uniref:Uncharacterized protein n=1 Tax=Calocera cornea HHB12733 TaxID=1353952 RepID=A0A165E3N8_9BASI|nr:hypothetical protein CALCODRAFT_511016 [Calocera cornea HHB12733]